MISPPTTGRAIIGPAARAPRRNASSNAALATRTILGLMPRLAVRAPRDSAAAARARTSGDATSVTGRGPQVAGAETAELALAGVESRDRLDKVLLVEIGPQRVGEMELGVGRLPDKEVGDPLLARGPDHQLRLRQVGVVEGAGDVLVAKPGKVHPPGRQVPDGIDDLRPAAVVDQQVEDPAMVVAGGFLGGALFFFAKPSGARPAARRPAAVVDQQVEDPAMVVAGVFLGGLYLLQQSRSDPRPASRDPHLYPFAVELVDLPVQGLREQAHQSLDLAPGPGPVFGRGRVEAQNP